MNGEPVGAWQPARGDAHTFTYAGSWVQSPRCRSLSLSLPITPSREVRGPAVLNYFDNLLPDNERIRLRLSARFRTASSAAFDLLTAIGRDCAGALQLLPDNTSPEGFDRIEAQRLGTADVARLLQGVTADPALGETSEFDDFRISIAGAQEKTALLRIQGHWHLPLGATPTTHILKLPLGLIGGRRANMSHSVDNEWLCAQILHTLGLPVAHTEIASFAGQQALVVERFDRQWMDQQRWIARLPQEDFCQAHGVAPQHKYEADGGPGISAILKLLEGSAAPDTDRTRFLLAQLAFWLLAATDGHAKNFSLFLHRGDQYRMTPLYDVISVWPIVGDGGSLIPWQRVSLAMALRSRRAHYRLAQIRTRHWRQLALASGVPGAWDAMLALVARTPTTLDTVEQQLPAGFPALVWDTIAAGMRSQVAAFQSELTER